MVHRHENHFLVDATGYSKPEELPFNSIAYRAPAWSTKGAILIVLTQELTGRDVLALVNYRGEIQKTIGVIEGYTSFLWSPNGKLAAISNTTGENPFEYKGLILVNLDGNLVNTLSTNTISSFFWSPDATKIIYSTRPNNNGIMSWILLDIINNTESELIKFIPSDEFYVMMAFFDQYAYSHSIWSPDSKSVVFSGNIVDQSSMEPLDLPDTNIYVLDISSGDTHILDKGTFATWTNK